MDMEKIPSAIIFVLPFILPYVISLHNRRLSQHYPFHIMFHLLAYVNTQQADSDAKCRIFSSATVSGVL